MNDALQEIAALTAHAGTQPTATNIPGVMIIKGEVPQHQLAALYFPMIGFVVQGAKIITIGGETVHAKAPSYFVIPTELPATGRVQQGPNGLPYLSVGMRLNPDLLADLLKDLPADAAAPRDAPGFCACPATPAFVDGWVRMLRLLTTPRDIPALAPVYERELLYRVLMGPQGWRLRQMAFDRGNASAIRSAIQWIRGNYAKPMNVQRVAAKHGMGVTTFHRAFKLATGLSPVQFQKELRLLEARKRMVFGGDAVAEAAFAVGYQSASQFNREYTRHFGASPARDAASVRRLETQRQAHRPGADTRVRSPELAEVPGWFGGDVWESNPSKTGLAPRARL